MNMSDYTFSLAIKIDDGTYFYSKDATYEEIREAMDEKRVKSKKYIKGFVTVRLNFVLKKIEKLAKSKK